MNGSRLLVIFVNAMFYLAIQINSLDTGAALLTPVIIFLVALGAGSVVFVAESRRIGARNLFYGSYSPRGSGSLILKRCIQLMILVFLSGITGSKIFSILIHPEAFMEAPLFVLFSGSGFVFYGGFMISMLVIIVFGARQKVRLAQLLDALMPALLFAYATGRLCCHLNGISVNGIENNLVKPDWLFFLPDQLWKRETGNGSHPFAVFPTQLYEAAVCYLLFIVTWMFRKKFHVPGELSGFGLALFGAQRFLVEELRWDYGFTLLFKQPQFFSLLLVFAGGMIFYTSYRKGRHRVFYSNYLRIRNSSRNKE